MDKNNKQKEFIISKPEKLLNKKKNEPDNIEIDKKSKIFFWFFIFVLAVSLGATYNRMFISKNYGISMEVGCDPEFESCFVWMCDSESEYEEDHCTGVVEEDVYFYKKIETKANFLSDCDPNDEKCPESKCADDNLNCSIFYCKDSELGDGEFCASSQNRDIWSPLIGLDTELNLDEDDIFLEENNGSDESRGLIELDDDCNDSSCRVDLKHKNEETEQLNLEILKDRKADDENEENEFELNLETTLINK